MSGKECFAFGVHNIRLIFVIRKCHQLVTFKPKAVQGKEAIVKKWFHWPPNEIIMANKRPSKRLKPVPGCSKADWRSRGGTVS